jgi:plasmid stabilization system protein ParE
MAKQVVWTATAKKARRQILEYWIEHNGSNVYSKKLSKLIREKINSLQLENYIGKPTDFKDVRASLVGYFSIFYKITETKIIIVGIWDNRRNPEDLRKNIAAE